MTELPDYRPFVEVVEAPWTGSGRFSAGQLRHSVVKAPDGRIAWDVFVKNGKTMARVWRRQDHPNLKELPANAPRKVKALYRAEGQLAFLRGTGEAWTDVAVLALQAWGEYQEAKASRAA